MDKKIISQNILRLREREGWTQAELGEKLYVSDKLVSKWERGESLPDADNIVKLAEMSKMSVGEFTENEKIYSAEPVGVPSKRRRLKYNAVSLIADIGIAALVTAMFALAIKAHAELPERIGIHFSVTGEADGFGGKNFLFLTPSLGIITAIPALILNIVKLRWSINLIVPVYLDTIAGGKAYESLLKIMSAGVNVFILFINAMFFHATYAMCKQEKLNIGLYFSWIGMALGTVFVCLVAGAIAADRAKKENGGNNGTE